MKKHLTIVSLFLTVALAASAQEAWTLQQCIDHAVANNITVAQARNIVAQSRLELAGSQHRYLPSIGASLGQSFDLGRSADKTGVIRDQSSTSTSFSVNASWEVFSGTARPKTVEIQKLNLRAATAGLSAAEEQVSLQVAEGFYNLLYQQEMIRVAEEQIKLTSETRRKTQSLVEAGKWSRDKLAEVDAKLAADSVSLLQAANDAELARYQLAMLLELSDYESLRISAPAIESSTRTPAVELAMSESDLLDQARATRPAIESARLQLESAKQQVKLSRMAYVPTLSLGAGYNNGYYYTLNKDLRAFNQPFADQIKNNGRYYVGLSLSIPIFNGMQTQDNVSRAELQVTDREIDLRRADKELSTQIYTARLNAKAAYSKIAAAESAAQSASTALEYAQISYDAGRTSTYELAEAQNRHFVATIDALRARYDYLYKVLVLQSYLK